MTGALNEIYCKVFFNISLCKFDAIAVKLAAKPRRPRRSQTPPSFQRAPFNFLNATDSQEGLTTSHLKKAKLMFFFTRYPSSHTLRTCFHDVQVSTQEALFFFLRL